MRRSFVLVLIAIGSLAASGACRKAAQPAVAVPAPAAADGSAFTGTVAETMNAGGYTYARLQAPGKEDIWIAATEFATKPGDRLTTSLEMPMPKFESKTLNRTFDLVYFVSSVSRDGQVVAGVPAEAAAGGEIAPMTGHAAAATPTVVVEPLAPAPGGLSIAELWAKRKELAGKEVIVRGKVVKVNNGILGSNWIHLQDGSGSAEDRTNDITVTTGAELKVGDVVTMKGVLAIGKDIGAGYAYDAIIEGASPVR